jgi:hypothetical protein
MRDHNIGPGSSLSGTVGPSQTPLRFVTRANGMRLASFSLRSTAGLPRASILDLKEAKKLLDEFDLSKEKLT